MYTVTYTKRGEKYPSEVETVPTMGQARKVAARMLGYRDIRSAFEYTATTSAGAEGIFYCRRGRAGQDIFDIVCIE